jgi:predicted ATPase
MIKHNYFILTGAMRGGKSTILAKLVEAGVYCVPEPARTLLAEQRMIQSAGVPELNAEAFNGLMLARAIYNYQEKQPLSDSIIFDRGIPDMIAYANLSRLDPTPSINASQAFRYNPTVFYFAGWQEIYTNDEERKIDFVGAQAFGVEVKAIYERLGYRILEVPRLSIAERAKFILERTLPATAGR